MKRQPVCKKCKKELRINLKTGKHGAAGTGMCHRCCKKCSICHEVIEKKGWCDRCGEVMQNITAAHASVPYDPDAPRIRVHKVHLPSSRS